MFTNARRTSLVVALAVFGLYAVAETAQLGIGGRPKPITVPYLASVNPGAVSGGQSAQCTVKLDSVVEGEDQVVDLTTDHPEAYSNFPQSVVVPVGYDTVVFDLYTTTVSGSVQTTVTASCGGGQASGTLTVNP